MNESYEFEYNIILDFEQQNILRERLSLNPYDIVKLAYDLSDSIDDFINFIKSSRDIELIKICIENYDDFELDSEDLTALNSVNKNTIGKSVFTGDEPIKEDEFAKITQAIEKESKETYINLLNS